METLTPLCLVMLAKKKSCKVEFFKFCARVFCVKVLQDSLEITKMKNNIKELRNKIKMTQEELGNKVGVRRETILFLEQGKYNPSLRLAYDISKVFKMSIEEVFYFEK